MRCCACDCAMSDREANRKYLNWREITDPEERYVGLCDECLSESDLAYQDPLDSMVDPNEDYIGEGE